MIGTITIYVITAICFAFLLSEVFFVLVSALAKDRTERITFLRSFKKGKCAVIYVTAIPLYVMGFIYSGEDFLKALFTSINKIINLVVLKYDFAGIEELMEDNFFYEITVYFCFVLVAVNALIFVFSISAQYIWEFCQSIKTKITTKDRVYIFGSNEKNVTIFRSDNGKRSKIIVGKLDKKESIDLYLEKIPYIATPYPQKMASKILKLVKKDALLGKRRKTSVIINTRSDEQNIKLCTEFWKQICLIDESKRADVLAIFGLYAYGDPKYEAIYEDIVANANGSFHYTNEYQKIAFDFVDEYPITQFMDENYIDYETSLIKDNVDINAVFVGFGRTNRQIFVSMATNDVLVTKVDDKVSLKKINCVIFDNKDHATENKNLNHSFYRFETELKNEIKTQKSNEELIRLAKEEPNEAKRQELLSGIVDTGYLPLPETVMDIESLKLDISNGSFYDKIRELVGEKEKRARLTYIVISFGTDLENIDMAQKIVEKLDEWDAKNVYVFVKARGWTKEQTSLEQENCFFIGNEAQTGFNIEKILGDEWKNLAHSRDALYSIESQIKTRDEITEELFDSVKQSIIKRWYTNLTSVQRDSNIFACLNMRVKLHLMGLDYRKRTGDENDKLSQDDYYEAYLGEGATIGGELSTSGRPILKEHCELELKDNRRGYLAIQEHLRWNAFMLSRGLVPSTISQIKAEKKNGKNTNGKSFGLRRHGNLTTMDGLIEFRKMIAERDGIDEYEADVIKYDYEMLDDAYWLLDNCGYEIIKKSR